MDARSVLSLLGRGAVAGVRAKDATLVGNEEADTINRSRSQAEAVRAIEAAEREYNQRRQTGQDQLNRQKAESQMDLEGAQAWAARNPRPRRYTETLAPKGKRTMFELDYDDPNYRRELGPAPEPMGSNGPTWSQGQREKDEETMGETWLRMNSKPEVLAEVQRVQTERDLSRGRAAWSVRNAISANNRDLATVQGVEGREDGLGEAEIRRSILGDLGMGGPPQPLPARPGVSLPPAPTTGPYGMGARPAAPAAAMPQVPAGYDADAYYGAMVDIGKITQQQYDSWKLSRRP